MMQTQGRRHGHIRYRDFVKAMGDSYSPREGSGKAGGRRYDNTGRRRKGVGGEHRHRSSADGIELLVDRLKEVRIVLW